uniref:Protein transport protein Sec24C n=1 Tax=Plectus sambesii TaxID=2011161 RepID=A0A914VCD2_9BILA
MAPMMPPAPPTFGDQQNGSTAQGYQLGPAPPQLAPRGFPAPGSVYRPQSGPMPNGAPPMMKPQPMPGNYPPQFGQPQVGQQSQQQNGFHPPSQQGQFPPQAVNGGSAMPPGPPSQSYPPMSSAQSNGYSMNPPQSSPAHGYDAPSVSSPPTMTHPTSAMASLNLHDSNPPQAPSFGMQQSSNGPQPPNPPHASQQGQSFPPLAAGGPPRMPSVSNGPPTMPSAHPQQSAPLNMSDGPTHEQPAAGMPPMPNNHFGGPGMMPHQQQQQQHHHQPSPMGMPPMPHAPTSWPPAQSAVGPSSGPPGMGGPGGPGGMHQPRPSMPPMPPAGQQFGGAMGMPPQQQGPMGAASPGWSGGFPQNAGPPGAPGLQSQRPPGMPGMPPTPGMPPMPPGGQQFGGPMGMPPQPQQQQHQGMMGAPGMPGMPGMPPGPPGMQAGPPGPGTGPPGMQQQKPRLDPNAMPSAVQVMEDDRTSRTGLFQTGYPHAEVPPLVTTDYYCQDQGNCNPKFMRSTLYCAPANQDMLKNSTIPFGVSISPFSSLHRNEHPIPVIDLGELGPVRCQRCKAYMCPSMEFQDGGRRFKCPFCRASSDVPETYFAHLDHSGRRTDIQHRPEQYLGSYEFVATKLYCKNGVAPKEPAFIFMLDVSYNAVSSGMVSIFCQNIRQLLEHLPKDTGMERSTMRVGFATYDQTIHFYNLKNALEQPQMMVVGDVNDVFVPLVDGFLVTLDEADTAIQNLLNEIPKMFAQTRITETLLGPAVQAGLDALRSADRSGKLFVFHTSLPVFEAPGKLKNRDDRKLLATDKEKTILNPQCDFYSKLAVECVQNGCCVDLFLFPNSFIDVATLGTLANMTGGNVYKYQYFEAAKDGERFLADLQHDIERPIAFDAMMRVRTSTGIRPTGFYGSFHMQNTTDIELAGIDCDKCINVEIRHDDKLDEPMAYIQAAVLFTSCGGQRRLRVHNLTLSTSADYNQLYRLADQDTVVNFMMKQAEQMLRDKSPKEVREFLSGRCAQVLASYRERCSEQAPLGQLILPECLKLLPLYINCVIKSDAMSGGSEMTVDDRAWMMQLVPSMRPEHSVFFLYPRVLPVTDLRLDGDTLDLPQPVRASADNLVPEQAFLIENGTVMFLWIGLGCPQPWVHDVFGVAAVTHIDTEKQTLPEKDNATSRALRRLIDHLHRDRPRRMKLFIIRQQDALEPWMKKFLVEDRSAGSNASYVDFLCYIHREIRSILS